MTLFFSNHTLLSLNCIRLDGIRLWSDLCCLINMCISRLSSHQHISTLSALPSETSQAPPPSNTNHVVMFADRGRISINTEFIIKVDCLFIGTAIHPNTQNPTIRYVIFFYTLSFSQYRCVSLSCGSVHHMCLQPSAPFCFGTETHCCIVQGIRGHL